MLDKVLCSKRSTDQGGESKNLTLASLPMTVKKNKRCKAISVNGGLKSLMPFFLIFFLVMTYAFSPAFNSFYNSPAVYADDSEPEEAAEEEEPEEEVEGENSNDEESEEEQNGEDSESEDSDGESSDEEDLEEELEGEADEEDADSEDSDVAGVEEKKSSKKTVIIIAVPVVVVLLIAGVVVLLLMKKKKKDGLEAKGFGAPPINNGPNNFSAPNKGFPQGPPGQQGPPMFGGMPQGMPQGMPPAPGMQGGMQGGANQRMGQVPPQGSYPPGPGAAPAGPASPGASPGASPINQGAAALGMAAAPGGIINQAQQQGVPFVQDIPFEKATPAAPPAPAAQAAPSTPQTPFAPSKAADEEVGGDVSLPPAFEEKVKKQEEKAPSYSEESYDKTVVISKDQLDSYEIGMSKLNSGTSSNQKYSGFMTDEIVIGRAAHIEGVKHLLTIKGEKTVSTKHCAIRQKDGKFFIRDLGSTNGTFVNGKRIKDEIEINSDDVLKLGLVEFKIGLHKKN